MVDKTLCECVFCGRTLGPKDAMFAWWLNRATDVVETAGLYCRGSCAALADAGQAMLLDVHAEQLPHHIERILTQYPNWIGGAARKAARTALAMTGDGEWR